MLEATRYDLLILDVRLAPATGATPKAVSARYSASVKAIPSGDLQHCHPREVVDLKSPLVRVVEKTQGVDALLEEVRELFKRDSRKSTVC
jgi:hypothetical protein